MRERYDSAAAEHYAAYRPPLHRYILSRLLGETGPLAVGLDVGCGTGTSSVALAEYCGHVYGVEPSRAMLARAVPAGRVDYLHGSAESVPLPAASVDVVTFAGSLFYADGPATHREILRVARPGAWVLVYDFELLLHEIMDTLGASLAGTSSSYDHRVNLSGVSGFTERSVSEERVEVPMLAGEQAHVLLSDSHRFDAFARHYRTNEPFARLKDELGSGAIKAVLYYAAYQAE